MSVLPTLTQNLCLGPGRKFAEAENGRQNRRGGIWKIKSSGCRAAIPKLGNLGLGLGSGYKTQELGLVLWLGLAAPFGMAALRNGGPES